MSSKPQKKTFKTVMAGGIAGMISKTCTAPLERAQMLNQTGATRNSIFGTLRSILVNDGIRGLWRGNFANCIRVFPHKSILFAVNESLRNHLNGGSSSSPSSTSLFVSGAFSGLCATAAIYPIDVIMANLAGTFDKRRNSLFSVASNIIKHEGLFGLYTGFGVTCIGAVPYEAVRMGVYGILKDKVSDNPFGQLFAGAIGGAAAGISTYPTDTVRRMLQVQCSDGMVIYDGVIQCIKINYYDGGILRFYYGLNAKLIRVIPDAAILFVAFEAIRDFLENNNTWNDRHGKQHGILQQKHLNVSA